MVVDTQLLPLRIRGRKMLLLILILLSLLIMAGYTLNRLTSLLVGFSFLIAAEATLAGSTASFFPLSDFNFANFGDTGTIDSAVCNLLSDKHLTIGTSNSSKLSVDLQKTESLNNTFKRHSDVDAIPCVAGSAGFGQLDSLTNSQIMFGIKKR